MIETHPLNFFLPSGAKLLMLGSFPPPHAKWSMDFFYPNMQNDMWRIFGIVFFNDKNYFLSSDSKKFDKEKIKRFLDKKRIAVGDTAHRVRRLSGNASDKCLEVVEPIAFSKTLKKIPDCLAVAVTGQKAADTLLGIVEASEPKVGNSSDFIFEGRRMSLWRMPSSSRAYPKPIEEKAKIYGSMFKALGLL